MAESMEQTIEILLVDDHALFRQGVTRLLETEPAFKVVACGSIKEALAVLRQRQIDIVLLDFDLGQRDGTRFVRFSENCRRRSTNSWNALVDKMSDFNLHDQGGT